MARGMPSLFCITLLGCSIETSGLETEEVPDSGGLDAGRSETGAGHDAGPQDACGACECRGDLECPPPTTGDWSDCMLPAGEPCAQDGMQTRVDSEWRCVDNRCMEFEDMFRQPCTVSTEGMSCGGSSSDDWSECIAPPDCSGAGTRSRTTYQSLCRSGLCALEPMTEMESCTVPTEGTKCMGSWSCWGTCSGSSCEGVDGCSSDSECSSVCPAGCTPDCVGIDVLGTCCQCAC